MKKAKINNELRKIQRVIIPVLKNNYVVKAGIFGSYARGEQKKNSDIDILVQFSKPVGFKFARIELELEKKLKKKVDLLTYNGLSPYLKDRILQEEVKIIWTIIMIL